MKTAPLSQFIKPEEVKSLTQKNAWQGAWVIAKAWLSIVAIFAVVVLWTNPISIIAAIILLGGRQLNLAIIMHDAGHHLLFKSRQANVFAGNWFAAYFLFLNTEHYAKQHSHHHGLSGTERDPDLPNFRAYPVSKASFLRKVGRDVFGITAIKFILGLILNKTGLMEKDDQHYRTVVKGVMVNVLFVAVLWSLNVTWLYALWIGAFFTSYMLVLRIRQAAEHGAVPDALNRDPRAHTRTTLANFAERLLFAPSKVNYHVEHHLIPNVPCYRLPELHKLLVERGYYQQYPVTQGYGVLMKDLIA
ncbi:fatty acid desaturase family protein [Alteromonas sp. a30]|uniref:fatty acid desaturase family protein n=1 Tax=Alteromonas sp. a30 TaxID=2730917 RepID=UPI0022828E31|nr:fatty acid desaturase family protein [Alteromonas sp. a30]MCY7297155.1 fatty acid desaturase family protein [Alteromonas sp. a30]